MYVRVVRFTDVASERVEAARDRIEERGGPPPGVPVKKVQMLFDAEQGTAVALQFFDTAENMRAAEEFFASVDPADTPGTRVSVDRCEVKLDLETSG